VQSSTNSATPRRRRTRDQRIMSPYPVPARASMGATADAATGAPGSVARHTATRRPNGAGWPSPRRPDACGYGQTRPVYGTPLRDEHAMTTKKQSAARANFARQRGPRTSRPRSVAPPPGAARRPRASSPARYSSEPITSTSCSSWSNLSRERSSCAGFPLGIAGGSAVTRLQGWARLPGG
jgi:hypothetical protein